MALERCPGAGKYTSSQGHVYTSRITVKGVTRIVCSNCGKRKS